MTVFGLASDESNGFNLNSRGDQVVAKTVSGDWARFSVSALNGSTWGSSVVVLEGSLDRSGSADADWFEINPSVRLDADFGISDPIAITAIPSLRVRVETAHGSNAPAIARITFANANR